jgi:hypothetical protein
MTGCRSSLQRATLEEASCEHRVDHQRTAERDRQSPTPGSCWRFHIAKGCEGSLGRRPESSSPPNCPRTTVTRVTHLGTNWRRPAEDCPLGTDRVRVGRNGTPSAKASAYVVTVPMVTVAICLWLVAISCGRGAPKVETSDSQPSSTGAAACKQEHDLLLDALVAGDPEERVARMRSLAETYRSMRGGTSTGTASQECSLLMEPTIREMATIWFTEGRRGHPRTHGFTKELLELYLEFFGDSEHAGIMSYRLAEVVAVLAIESKLLDDWREAARLYEQAYDRSTVGDIVTNPQHETVSLRDESLRGRIVALSNAASPYEAAGSDHRRALHLLSPHLDAIQPGSRRDELRVRERLLRAVTSADGSAELAGLWEVAADHESGSPVALVARDLLVGRIAALAAKERQMWARRLLDGTVPLDDEIRQCLVEVQRSKAPAPCERQRRDDWWFARPW